jgi:hypothetical protein
MLYHVCTFEAADDAGRVCTVLAYSGRPNATTPAAPESLQLRTLDGNAVERRERGRYRVRQTGAVLTSGSPNAP